jgi:hypothetical protein
VITILVHLKKLEIIETSLLERALDSLHPEENLKLKKITVGSRFWSGSDYILRNLKTLCPNLTQLNLPNASRDQLLHLESICNLTHLTHLHIGQIKFLDLIPVLKSLGSKLASFTYSNFSESAWIDCIAMYCPNLQSLGLNSGSLVNLNQNSTAKMPPNLTELKLNIHALIARNSWIRILSECPELTDLDMTPAEELTDETFIETLNLNSKSLSELRSFVVRGRHRAGDVNLSENTIKELVQRCPHIKFIGDCSTWSLSSNTFSDFLHF